MPNWRFLPFFLFLFLSGFGLLLFHRPILTHMADSLIVSDALEKADRIVVLSGDVTSRCQVAAELFLQGWAPRILVTRSYYPDEAKALKRYGIRELEYHEKCLAILRFNQVPEQAIEVLEGYNASTADEARTLWHYLRGQDVKRLLVVTSNFHTRRSRLLFQRVFRGTEIQVSMQATPPNFLFDPKAWWTRRKDRQVLLLEYQKLAFYAVRYW